MSQWIKMTLAVAMIAVGVVESRVIPAEPVSVMMDAYGNPVVFLREKRAPIRSQYPQQSMMFTSYYRPVRRSNNQATGVFAQGNAVSGQAFFDMQSPLMKNGPEPIEEPEVSSADAQAAPGVEENLRDNEEGVQEPQGYTPQHHHQQHHDTPHHHYHDEHHHQHDYHHGHSEQEDEQQHDVQPPQEQEPEPLPVYTTEAAIVAPAEESAPSNTEATETKKAKKPRKPVILEDDDEDDEIEDYEPTVPFVPMKGNRRRQGYPNLNNFFPMVFSFPGMNSRAGSGSGAGSPPGTITAIANSYSTGKGGLASSVATAYGGSPPSKKRRMPQQSEE